MEQELDDELRASLDALAEEHIRNGASPQDAMRPARIELGGAEQVREEVRGVRDRIVLGATRTSIQWLIMREVSLMAAAGRVLGLTTFLLAGRVLFAVIFGLTPSDPASLAIGVAVLGGTAFLAGFLPAYRATNVDPALTIRQE